MISIVIPLFNKAHTIENTLKSVLGQIYGNYEIIIVNDGSTDNGTEVIRNYTQDPRLRIIDQTNQGVSSARNIGVSAAKYDYVAFLDGDDEWLPEYLLKMQEAINLFPAAGMICCGGIIRNADGSIINRLVKKFLGKITIIDFFENPQVILHTSATIVSKKEFNKTSGFPIGMKRNQDFALFFSLALVTEVVYCGFPLTIYVGGVQGQATSTPKEKVLVHVVHRFNLVFDNWVKSGGRNSTFLIYLKYELRHMFIEFLRKKDYDSLRFMTNNLSPSLLKIFSKFETGLLNNIHLRNASIAYLMITKLRWRMYGYPYVGQI